MDEIVGIGWDDIVVALLRRWKLILVIFTCGVVGGGTLAFIQQPTYEASAKLMITSERARITVSPDPHSGPTVERVTDQELNSEVALLQSPRLVREVLEPYRSEMERTEQTGLLHRVATGLRRLPDLPLALYRRMHDVAPPTRFEQWVQEVSSQVKVTPIKTSNLIDVSFASPRPEWTAEFINELAKHHVERHARLTQQSEALGFLESQRRLLNDKMRQAEAALTAFYDHQGIDVATEQRAALRLRVAKLEQTMANSETALAEATARTEFLSRDIQSHPAGTVMEPGAAQGGPLQLIRSRIIELQLQRSDLLSKFAPTSLRVQAIDKQIEEAKRLLGVEENRGGGSGANPVLALELSKAREQLAAVRARVQSLRDQIVTSRGTLDHLEQNAPQQERLEQEVAAAKEAYLTYSKKVEEARFSDALDQSRIVNVSVVERAEVPAAPRPSKRSFMLIFGALLGLGLGGGLALLLDRLDPRVDGAATVQRITGLKILADIPS